MISADLEQISWLWLIAVAATQWKLIWIKFGADVSKIAICEPDLNTQIAIVLILISPDRDQVTLVQVAKMLQYISWSINFCLLLA